MSLEEVQDAYAVAQEFRPEPPRPLRREMSDSEPFPIEALGTLLGPAARAIHEKVQAPEAICAQSVLGAATLAVQAHADVELPIGRSRPISSFLVSVAETGDRKTTADEIALSAVLKHENHLRIRYREDRARFKNRQAAWEKQRSQILADNVHSTTEAKEAALRRLGDGPNEPLLPMLTCPEPTYEGLVKLLRYGQPSIGVFSSEGGRFIGGHAMSEEHRLKTAAALSELWDGSPIRRVRQGDGAFVLYGRRVALNLMLQPTIAPDLLADPLLAGQGLLSRVLVVSPRSSAGARFWKEPTAENERAVQSLEDRLMNALRAPPPLAHNVANELAPRLLVLSAEARRQWIGFADHIESLIGSGGPLEPIRGLANKLPEHAARLAAVLTLIEDLERGELPADFMAAGIRLAQHYAAEALRLFDAAMVDPDVVLAERTLAWLHAWGEPVVSLPDVYQRGPSRIRDKGTAERMVRILEDHGWLLRIPEGAEVGGVHRRNAWRIVKRPPA